jgi:hypothetical protein
MSYDFTGRFGSMLKVFASLVRLVLFLFAGAAPAPTDAPSGTATGFTL